MASVAARARITGNLPPERSRGCRVVDRVHRALVAEEARADEFTRCRKRCDDDLHLIGQLVGQRLLDQQRIPRHQRALALHLAGIRLAHEIQSIGLRIREFFPRIGFALGLDAARLRGALRGANTRDFVGFGLELPLLDLLLLEGQDVLHGLLLRAGCDDLLLAGGFRRRLPPHLVGLGLELLLFDLRLLELEGVMNFFGLEFLGEELLHSGSIVGRQIDLSYIDFAQHEAHGGEFRLELRNELLLYLRPPLRERFPARSSGQRWDRRFPERRARRDPRRCRPEIPLTSGRGGQGPRSSEP